MRKLTFKLLIASILASPGDALQIIPIRDHDTTEVDISTFEHTRISVENDRIAQLFGMDGRVSFEVDELNGQVFITPAPDLKGHSVLITLTTEKGLTQDLRIKPVQKVADAILLRPKAHSVLGRSLGERETYERSILQLIKAYGERKNQEGVQFIKLEEEVLDHLSPELKVTLSTELHSSQFIGKVCQVKNQGENTLLLSSHHFAKYQPLAIAFQQRGLKPSEHTEVLIITRKNPS